jgi:hypothetical protein
MLALLHAPPDPEHDAYQDGEEAADARRSAEMLGRVLCFLGLGFLAFLTIVLTS